MKKAYAVINTMSAVGQDSIGAVMSIHRKLEVAQRTAERIQRQTRKANGATAYLPLRIVKLTGVPVHHLIANDEWSEYCSE